MWGLDLKYPPTLLPPHSLLKQSNELGLTLRCSKAFAIADYFIPELGFLVWEVSLTCVLCSTGLGFDGLILSKFQDLQVPEQVVVTYL